MDMNMDMNMDITSSPTISATPMSMPAMEMTFSADTRVTLFFTQWVTSTSTQYAFTLIFLFVLGIFNRFLAALKSQLDRRWNTSTDRDHSEPNEELEPLSPAVTGGGFASEKSRGREKKIFWIANGPWSMKKDGARALFEFTRAIIGYVLMLAVMTYNIGIFFAVTTSVLLGELIFGRYTRSTQGWQEGGCHE